MYRTQPQHIHRWFVQLGALLPKKYATNISSNHDPDNVVDVDIPVPVELNAAFFTRILGANYWKWHPILDKHPELKTLKSKDVINTAKILKKFRFTCDDIMTKPMILYLNELTLENRYSVLKECGVDKVTISLLSKYVAVMNRNVANLKSFGHIPYESNVIERLQGTFTDIELKLPTPFTWHENMELKILRQHILNLYLQQKLDMSASDLEKCWKVYGRIRHKSFHSVQNMVQILQMELQFPNQRINKNAFMLYGDPDNVRRIIKEIPSIDGHDIREILYKRPKIMMSSCDALLTTLQYIKQFGIGEDAVLRCVEVLTLGPDTVLERLKDLNEIKEFQVLSTNPRVLRLVHYQNKARLRLDYLNQLKVRCASLHILSCGSEVFAKFARDGSDRTKGRDIVVYLSNIMDKPERDLRNLLSRHPNWCHIPALQVKECYEFLISQNFTVNDIYNNAHLLLYPIQRIEEKLKQINTEEFLEDLQLKPSEHELSNNEILTLVLYLIESEFHFTGDGIWTEQHAQHVENFNNLLPDFPESLNKIYKYGVKPTESPKSSPKTPLESAKEYVLN